MAKMNSTNILNLFHEFLDENEDSDGHRLAEFLGQNKPPTRRPLFGDFVPKPFEYNIDLEPLERSEVAVDSSQPKLPDENEVANKDDGQSDAANNQLVDKNAQALSNENVISPKSYALRPRERLSTPRSGNNRDKLRRFSLNRLSAVKRRTLLKEFEDTVKSGEFSPNLFSTPLPASPKRNRSKSMDSPARTYTIEPGSDPGELRLKLINSTTEPARPKKQTSETTITSNKSAYRRSLPPPKSASRMLSPSVSAPPAKSPALRRSLSSRVSKTPMKEATSPNIINRTRTSINKPKNNSSQVQVLLAENTPPSKSPQPLYIGENDVDVFIPETQDVAPGVQEVINSSRSWNAPVVVIPMTQIIRNNGGDTTPTSRTETQTCNNNTAANGRTSVSKTIENNDSNEMNKTLQQEDANKTPVGESQILAAHISKAKGGEPASTNQHATDSDALRLSDILTDDDDVDETNDPVQSSRRYDTSSKPLNLIAKPKMRKRASSVPDTQQVRNPNAPTYMAAINLRHNSNKQKRTDAPAPLPLNKAPNTPINGEKFADELKANLNRLTNRQILDLRKRNSQGMVYPFHVANTLTEKKNALNNQLCLEEHIQWELLKRDFEGENPESLTTSTATTHAKNISKRKSMSMLLLPPESENPESFTTSTATTKANATTTAQKTTRSKNISKRKSVSMLLPPPEFCDTYYTEDDIPVAIKIEIPAENGHTNYAIEEDDLEVIAIDEQQLQQQLERQEPAIDIAIERSMNLEIQEDNPQSEVINELLQIITHKDYESSLVDDFSCDKVSFMPTQTSTVNKTSKRSYKKNNVPDDVRQYLKATTRVRKTRRKTDTLSKRSLYTKGLSDSESDNINNNNCNVSCNRLSPETSPTASVSNVARVSVLPAPPTPFNNVEQPLQENPTADEPQVEADQHNVSQVYEIENNATFKKPLPPKIKGRGRPRKNENNSNVERGSASDLQENETTDDATGETTLRRSKRGQVPRKNTWSMRSTDPTPLPQVMYMGLLLKRLSAAERKNRKTIQSKHRSYADVVNSIRLLSPEEDQKSTRPRTKKAMESIAEENTADSQKQSQANKQRKSHAQQHGKHKKTASSRLEPIADTEVEVEEQEKRSEVPPPRISKERKAISSSTQTITEPIAEVDKPQKQSQNRKNHGANRKRKTSNSGTITNTGDTSKPLSLNSIVEDIEEPASSEYLNHRETSKKRKMSNSDATTNMGETSMSSLKLSIAEDAEKPTSSVYRKNATATAEQNTKNTKLHNNQSHNNTGLERSRLLITTAPVEQINRLFDTHRHQNEQSPSSSTSTSGKRKELRVRLRRTRLQPKDNNVEQAKAANMTEQRNSSQPKRDLELISWLKDVTLTNDVNKNKERLFQELRCSSLDNVVITELDGIDSVFYTNNDQNKSDLGYLRFRPHQTKPSKRSKSYCLNYVVLSGNFKIYTHNEVGNFRNGDLVSITKGMRYSIENDSDEVGILMVVKK